MPPVAPMRAADDYWATVKRDDSNVLLFQRNDVAWGGAGFRVCVADDCGQSLLQVSLARTADACEADWQWALGVLSAETRRGRAPQPEKLAAAFLALWNKGHAKAERLQMQPAADARQTAQQWGADAERVAGDILRVDDTACRVLHVADHFDSHGYPAPPRTASSSSATAAADGVVGGGRRRGAAPQRATVAVEYSSARQIQERRLRLALNSYRSVVKQPQSLPGQQQRIARAQLRSLSISAEGGFAAGAAARQQQLELALSVPPQPQRTPPRPSSEMVLSAAAASASASSRSPRRNLTMVQLRRPPSDGAAGGESL